MKYSDIRDEIKSGDVLAWSHRKLKSWYDLKVMFVRIFTMSEYTHVGVAIVLGGRVWVLESVTPHIRLIPLSNALPCYILQSNEITSDADIEKGLSLVGKEDINYSQLEAIKALFGKNNKKDKKIECAEFVSFFKNWNIKDVPSDVVDYALSNGYKMIKIE